MIFLVNSMKWILMLQICSLCWQLIHGNSSGSRFEIGEESLQLMQKLQQEKDLYNLEYSLAKIEGMRFNQLAQRLQSQGYEIRGFYHTSKWREFWPQVVAEQLLLLDGKRKMPHKHRYTSQNDPSIKKDYDPNHEKYYNDLTLPYGAYEWYHDSSNIEEFASLLNITTELYMNIVGENRNDFEIMKNFVHNLPLRNQKKIVFNFNTTIPRYAYNGFNEKKKKEYDAKTDLSTGEYSTVMKLYNYCSAMKQQNKKAIVYYFHNKGTCCVKNNEDYSKSNPVANWREYMNTVNLEFPSICLRAIFSKKYLACGAENQDGHYSGNFWWADCSHVALLPPLRLKYDFGESEFFVLRGHEDFGTLRNFGFKCGYSIYNCGVNLYDKECTRHKVREQVLVKSIPHKLTPNNVYKNDDNMGKCRELLKKGKKYWEMPNEVRAAVQG